jgi:prophage maintenance system killer protein
LLPPIPNELDVKESIDRIIQSEFDDIDIAVELTLYCMKTQIFIDGNKRASIIFANHFMIQKGLGLLVVPENIVPEFKSLLVAYYEGRDEAAIKQFLKERCWRQF